ncbi:MAG: glutathione-disulfide reductase [Alphaproteobacteria bacterium]|nr:glutathione-disulfide reductase [Alphaproteobacteria bacterium]
MNERNYDYDYFVIGAGSAGVRSARIAASHGAKVGVAEASALGGTCVNLGCVPKKIMAYGADYHGHFRDAKGYGWDVPDEIGFDWNTLIKHQRAEITRLNKAYESTLENNGVEILNGFATFIDAHTVDVDGRVVSADKILIAVGGKPRVPHQDGGDLMATSDDMFSWPTPPKRVVIVGGGYIAVEFAHILHGIGAKVDLLYRGEMFLRGFDDDLRSHLADSMREQGIGVHFNTDLQSCEKTDDGFVIHTDTGEAFECDVPLAAIGRTPETGGLNLEAAGVARLDNGQIDVNEDYQSSVSNIYACGDVANQDNLTPVAIKEGHVIADRLFNTQRDRSVHYDNIATAVFSDPPIATIGLTQEQAENEGYEVSVFLSKFTPMRNQLAKKMERSLMKMIVDIKSDRVLGLHMIGLDAPEILQGFAVAMNCGATKADFDRTMPIHPTSAEEFVTLT